MVNRKIVMLILGQVVVGLLAVGCGDSGSEDSIDKATFVKRADTICEKTSGRMSAETKALIAEESDGVPGAPEGQALNRIIKQVAIPGLETELEEIRALGVPSGAEAQVQAFLAALQKAIDTGRKKPAAFASSESIPYEAAEVAGRKVGLSSCPVTPVNAN